MTRVKRMVRSERRRRVAGHGVVVVVTVMIVRHVVCFLVVIRMKTRVKRGM